MHNRHIYFTFQYPLQNYLFPADIDPSREQVRPPTCVNGPVATTSISDRLSELIPSGGTRQRYLEKRMFYVCER